VEEWKHRNAERVARPWFEDAVEKSLQRVAVKCHPPGNRDPTEQELANCRPYLVEEVETVEPGAVLTTGKHATETVLALDGESLDGFLDGVLDPRESDALGVPVVPLLHPSYQEVWLSRLGYEREGYVDAISGAVERPLE